MFPRNVVAELTSTPPNDGTTLTLMVFTGSARDQDPGLLNAGAGATRCTGCARYTHERIGPGTRNSMTPASGKRHSWRTRHRRHWLRRQVALATRVHARNGRSAARQRRATQSDSGMRADARELKVPRWSVISADAANGGPVTTRQSRHFFPLPNGGHRPIAPLDAESKRFPRLLRGRFPGAIHSARHDAPGKSTPRSTRQATSDWTLIAK